MALDSQQIEIIGRGHLIAALIGDGVEVAQPIRDRGTDLIAYLEHEQCGWVGAPIQLKAFSDRGWSAHHKHEGLTYVWAWHVASPADVEFYGATYAEAVGIAEAMGYTKTASWKKAGYTVTRPGEKLTQQLVQFHMGPGSWRKLVLRSSRRR